MSGHVVIVKPTGDIEKRAVEAKGPPELELLQALVGGYIEHVRIKWDGRVRDAYLNEDGISKALPLNPVATMLIHEGGYAHRGARGNLVIWVPAAKGVKRGKE